MNAMLLSAPTVSFVKLFGAAKAPPEIKPATVIARTVFEAWKRVFMGNSKK